MTTLPDVTSVTYTYDFWQPSYPVVSAGENWMDKDRRPYRVERVVIEEADGRVELAVTGRRLTADGSRLDRRYSYSETLFEPTTCTEGRVRRFDKAMLDAHMARYHPSAAE